MELIEPSLEYKDSFIEAVREFQADDDNSHRAKWYRKLVMAELESDFESFVERERSHARGENLREGYVPYTVYWLVDGGEFIGQVDIRHQLTAHLRKIGGQLGYDIRPSKRRRGYGKKILQLTLENAKELGMERVLVTCDINNEPSRKIIEQNGGILENTVPNPEGGADKGRYWIDLK